MKREYLKGAWKRSEDLTRLEGEIVNLREKVERLESERDIVKQRLEVEQADSKQLIGSMGEFTWTTL